MTTPKKLLYLTPFCLLFLSVNKSHSNVFCIRNKVYTKISSGLIFYENIKNKYESSMYVNQGVDPSFPVSIAIGYNFNKNIAAELQGSFSTLNYESTYDNIPYSYSQQQVKFYTLFANIYYKHIISKSFIPYIALGPGYTFTRSSTYKATSTINNPFFGNLSVPGKNISSFAWNIGFGSVINLKKNFALDIGYRYISLGKMGVKEGDLVSSADEIFIKAHTITIGLIYKF